jgi:3',5'-nucleoside bisphosphate phosphatase
MLVELHAHTSRHSPCSHVDPVSLVRRVMKMGIQGLVFTEHDYLWSPSELEALKAEVGAGNDFLLLAGQEVGTDFGHVLVFGPDHTIAGRHSLAELRALYPGAALVWAHPLRSGKTPREDRLLSPDLDAVEIFNSNHSVKGNYLGLMLWHRHKFTAVSGSDTHAPDTAGILPTLFDHPVSGIDDLVTEIRQGRCRPLCKEITRAGSNMLVDEIVLGTKGEQETRPRVIVKRPKDLGGWKHLEESARTLMHVRDHGFSSSVFRVPPVLDIDAQHRFVIEEGQRGRSLFDLLVQVAPVVGDEYFRLAALWIAKLHKARIILGSPMMTGQREFRRYDAYLRNFRKTGSPYLEEAERLLDAVAGYEEGLWEEKSKDLVLIHGDYHPKNIIIGQDLMQDISTLFISVVDFGSAMLFHPAFDVGCFISQFENQFRNYPRILGHYRAEAFIENYIEGYGAVDLPPFLEAVKIFQVRANLSIASFLIHVGKGESQDMQEVMGRSLDLLD